MGNTSSGNFVASLELSPDPVHTCSEYDLFDASNGYKKLSLFVFKATASADLELISFQKWKQLRHPFILQYLDSGIYKGRKCLLTEHVTPISTLLDKTGPHRIETHEELIAGFNDILEAIKFINEICDCSHNHITLEWIMASSKSYGTWKLGGLHLISKKAEETADFARRLIAYKKANLPSCMSLLSPDNSSVTSIEPLSTLPHVYLRDSYAIGKLMSKLFKKSSSIDPLVDLYSNNNPLPQIRDILTSDLFTNSCYLKLKKSLASFATLNEDDKVKLITSIPSMIQGISEFLLSSKVIPMLLASRLIMLHPSAKESLHAYLLVPEGKFHPSVSKYLISCVNFEIYIIPVILKMFLVKRIGLRLILLNYLQYYGHLIPDIAIDKIILPQVKIGLKDCNDEIVIASLQSMATLVSIFGGDVIIGSKDRKKYFHYDGPRVTEKHSFSASSSSSSTIDITKDDATAAAASNVSHLLTNGSDSSKSNWLNDENSIQFTHISINDRSEPDGGEFTCSPPSHVTSSAMLMKQSPWHTVDQWHATYSTTRDDDTGHSSDHHHHHHHLATSPSSTVDVQSNFDIPSAINISLSSNALFSTPQDTHSKSYHNSLSSSSHGISEQNNSSTHSITTATISSTNTVASSYSSSSLSTSLKTSDRSKVTMKPGELSKITSFDVKEIDIKLSDEIEDLFSEMEPSIDFKIAHMPSSHASSTGGSIAVKIASTSLVTHEKTLKATNSSTISDTLSSHDTGIIASVIGSSSLFALSHESTDQNNLGDWSNDEWDDNDEQDLDQDDDEFHSQSNVNCHQDQPCNKSPDCISSHVIEEENIKTDSNINSCHVESVTSDDNNDMHEIFKSIYVDEINCQPDNVNIQHASCSLDKSESDTTKHVTL